MLLTDHLSLETSQLCPSVMTIEWTTSSCKKITPLHNQAEYSEYILKHTCYELFSINRSELRRTCWQPESVSSATAFVVVFTLLYTDFVSVVTDGDIYVEVISVAGTDGCSWWTRNEGIVYSCLFGMHLPVLNYFLFVNCRINYTLLSVASAIYMYVLVSDDIVAS